MKLGITGLPGSGKTTVFEALTRNIPATLNKSEHRISTIHVPDDRVDVLSRMYNPKKTVYAQVEYFLPGKPDKSDKKKEANIWAPVKECDALIHVVRNFRGYGADPPNPYSDFMKLDQEFVFSDLVSADKRIERIELDRKRGKVADPEELPMIQECKQQLENEMPLRRFPELANARVLRGYAYLSAKPVLVLFNNEDDDEAAPDAGELTSAENCMVIRGKLERELAQMSEDDAKDFLSEYHISASATDRVIQRSYELLGLMSFFTVGDDEVRAWTIKKGTCALDAAEVIHSDLKKGFIRAEVLAYQDLMQAGSYAEARKRGTVRLEGKTYPVQDGDIVHIRFNV